ncbi:MAG: RagB/SusD family nutrient uptake outer membrane protein [Chitinophagaceae bacterium]
MKNNNIISSILFGLLFTGCSKGLDLVPKDTISDGTFWKTSIDFKLATNNLYLSLQGFNTDDAQSDIAYNVANPVSNGTWQTTENDNNWNSPYVYIRRCNNILAKASSSSIAADLKQSVAEAKFFRAYNYWRLFELYGGVPLITDVLDIVDQGLYTAKATREETADFIIKDLTEAAIDLSEKKSLSSADIGRITRGAANSLKARVALFQGSWQKNRGAANSSKYLEIAIKAADDVINSSQYALYTAKGKQSYRYLFIEDGDNASETIIDRRYQTNISTQGFPFTIITGSLLPTKKLADLYLCTDGLPVTSSPLFAGYNTPVSEFQNRDPRMAMTFIIPGTPVAQYLYPAPEPSWPFYPQRNPNTGYTTYKFISEDVFFNTISSSGSGVYEFDFHLLRYAEILLIYAEASFEKNGNISDADLNKSINLIRARVGLPNLTNVFVGTNGLNMRDEIRRERTTELALEGFRRDDLRRWKTAETELPQAVKGIKIVGTGWTNPVVINGANRNPYAGAIWQTKTDANGFIISESNTDRKFDAARDYLWFIPTKEILLNPKLEQNPGW